MNAISTAESLPSFRWRKSARSDSTPQIVSTFNGQPTQQQAKFIDFTFLQTLPKYVFGQLKRPQSADYLSLNSLERPVLDSYHSYETSLSSEPATVQAFDRKRSSINNPIVLKNELDDFNDIYSTNEPYEDDDVIVIPFTKHRGQAFKDGRPYSGKNVQGVPQPPAPVGGGFDSVSSNDQATSNLKIEKKFASKMITDSEDDLDTGDELPSSLSDTESTADFKVQFSDLHPVYVKPPKEFQPIFYPNREIDGVKLTNRNDEATIKPLVTDKNQELPNRYPNGLSSWILGGYRFGNRGAFWESLLADESLYGYNGKKTTESNDNSLDKLDFSDKHKPIKTDLNNRLSEDDKLEIISLNEPKSRTTADDDLIELTKEKKVKKPTLIGKLRSSSTVLSSKSNLLKRKLNLRPKKVKILTKANKLDNNSKRMN